jgi:phosphate starvation-inducible PhoH-like protein
MNYFFFAQALLVLSGLGSGKGYLRSTKMLYNQFTLRPFFLPTRLQRSLSFDSAIQGKKRDIIEWSLPFAESNKKTTSRKIRSFSSKTENQAFYLDLMRDENVDIVIAVGPAGTGKTMLACYAAVEALRIGKIRKIVITRPVVSVDEELGYLPGGIASKMDPWTRPVFDALRETYSPKEIDAMMEDGVIEIVPLGFMRGRTFKNTWIIADEMQNSTPTQMLMLTTRIGEGSKMIITGDLNQSDLSARNGLQHIHSKIQSVGNTDHIRLIVLESSDVQRSRAVKSVLRLFSDEKPTIQVSTPVAANENQEDFVDNSYSPPLAENVQPNSEKMSPFATRSPISA